MQTVDNPLAIQEFWDQCFSLLKEKHPFATSVWHNNYLESFKLKQKPLFFIDETLKVIAPLTSLNKTVQFSGGHEISDYMDLVGSESNFENMWTRLIPELNKLECKLLDLYNVAETSPTFAYFTKLKQDKTAAVTIEREDTTPIIHLPNDFAEYKQLLPHKQRHELERKLRKFEREHAGCQIQKSENLEQSMDQLLELMRFQDHKKEFLTPENVAFFRKLANISPDSLKKTFYSVIVENATVAVVVGFKMNDTFYLYNTGFNFNDFPGAGFYIHTKAIEQEILSGTKIYNFLQGNERYKYDLGGKDNFVYRIKASIEDLTGL